MQGHPEPANVHQMAVEWTKGAEWRGLASVAGGEIATLSCALVDADEVRQELDDCGLPVCQLSLKHKRIHRCRLRGGQKHYSAIMLMPPQGSCHQFSSTLRSQFGYRTGARRTPFTLSAQANGRSGTA